MVEVSSIFRKTSSLSPGYRTPTVSAALLSIGKPPSTMKGARVPDDAWIVNPARELPVVSANN